PIHIFVGAYLLGYALNGYMIWQRQLNDKAIDIVIIVDVVDMIHQPVFADCISESHHSVVKTNRLARFDLVVNVSLARTVVADEDDSKVRDFLPLLFAGGNPLRDFLFDVG